MFINLAAPLADLGLAVPGWGGLADFGILKSHGTAFWRSSTTPKSPRPMSLIGTQAEIIFS